MSATSLIEPSGQRWRVVDKGFIGLKNYDKAVGDWWGALYFLLGFCILLGAYYVWEKVFKARRQTGFIAQLTTVAVILAGCTVIAAGWTRMITEGDDRFLDSLPITFYYAIFTVPIQIAIALVLAYILYQKIVGQELFRMIFFLPYITPVIATAIVFRLLGTEIEGFFAGPSLALIAIVMFGIWTYVGYNTVIFLAGLGSIPPALYEAAEIDGANKWESFFHITIPLLSPVTFYLSLIGFIGTFKAFNHIFVMQEPAAQGTVVTTSLAIYNAAFKASQFGYASAQAILLFVVILFLTFAQTRLFGEKVFYG